MNIYHNPLIIFVIINNFFDYFVHGMRARSEGPISPLGKKRLLVIMSWPQVPPLYFQLYSNNHKTTKSARCLSFGFWRVSKKRQKLLESSLSVSQVTYIPCIVQIYLPLFIRRSKWFLPEYNYMREKWLLWIFKIIMKNKNISWIPDANVI